MVLSTVMFDHPKDGPHELCVSSASTERDIWTLIHELRHELNWQYSFVQFLDYMCIGNRNENIKSIMHTSLGPGSQDLPVSLAFPGFDGRLSLLKAGRHRGVMHNSRGAIGGLHAR